MGTENFVHNHFASAFKLKEGVISLISEDEALQWKSKDSHLLIGIPKGTSSNVTRLSLAILAKSGLTLFVVRSYCSEVHDKCGVLIEVGEKFDTDSRRFNHKKAKYEDLPRFLSESHSKSPITAAGALWNIYAENILNTARQNGAIDDEEFHSSLKTLKEKVYVGMIEGLDASAFGVDLTENKEYFFGSIPFPLRCAAANEESYGSQLMDPIINEVKPLFESFGWLVDSAVNCDLVGRVWIKDAFQKRFNDHPSGRILIFERFVDWRKSIYSFENTFKLDESSYILWVVTKNDDGQWRATAVSEENNRFTNRSLFPEPMRGLRADKLNEVVGITDGVFVHNAGFTGGALSKEGVLKMVQMALESHNVQNK